MNYEVPAALASAYADRGTEQWVYGEIRSAVELLGILRSAAASDADLAAEEEVFLDFGSGDGDLVLGMAKLGVRSVGIELVPAHHRNAMAALARAPPTVQAKTELLCEDGLAVTAPISGATLVVCNNAVWDDALNARVVAHIGAHATALAVLATTKKIRAAAAAAAGLRLVRATAVDVDWNPSGWPLYLYQRVGVECAAPPRVEPGFFSAAAFTSQRRYHLVELACDDADERDADAIYAAVAAAVERAGSPAELGLTAAGCDSLLGLLRCLGAAEPADGGEHCLVQLGATRGATVMSAYLLLLAASVGLRSAGVAAVAGDAERHHGDVGGDQQQHRAAVERAIAHLPPGVRGRIEVHTDSAASAAAGGGADDDAVARRRLRQRATLMVCGSGAWYGGQLSPWVTEAPRLCVLAATAQIPAELAAAAGLVLTRATAVPNEGLGQLIFVYEHAAALALAGRESGPKASVEDARHLLAQNYWGF